MNRSVLAFERCSALLTLTTDHPDPVGVLVVHFAPLGHFESLLRVVFRLAPNAHRSALIHPQPPLGNIEVVSAPIGHLTAGVVPEKTEVVMNTLRFVDMVRSRPQPEVIVEFRRHGLRFRDWLLLTKLHAR